jgi:hypothetical protein
VRFDPFYLVTPWNFAKIDYAMLPAFWALFTLACTQFLRIFFRLKLFSYINKQSMELVKKENPSDRCIFGISFNNRFRFFFVMTHKAFYACSRNSLIKNVWCIQRLEELKNAKGICLNEKKTYRHSSSFDSIKEFFPTR